MTRLLEGHDGLFFIAPSKQRRAGRPALPAHRRKVSTSITILPEHLDYALKQAEAAGVTGNLSAGIGLLISRAIAAEAAALEAIKAAAERRDQTTVSESAFD